VSLLEIENKELIFHIDFLIVVTSAVVCTGHIPWQDLPDDADCPTVIMERLRMGK
jgi:hypothetical protein